MTTREGVTNTSLAKKGETIQSIQEPSRSWEDDAKQPRDGTFVAPSGYRPQHGAIKTKHLMISKILREGKAINCQIVRWPQPKCGKYDKHVKGCLYWTIDVSVDGEFFAVDFSSHRFHSLMRSMYVVHPELPLEVELVRRGQGPKASYYGRIVDKLD